MRQEYPPCYISVKETGSGATVVIRLRKLLLSTTLAFVVLAFNATPSTAQVATKPAPVPVDTNARVTQTLVDSTIPEDSAVNKMLEAYAPKVRGLSEVIGKLRGDLRKGGLGAGSVGNFVTNGMKAAAERKLGKPVAVALTNSGGLRKNVITEGDLRLQDMFELLPFENALFAFDLTGAQVIELLRGVTGRRDAQSGAKIKYKLNAQKRPQLEAVRLLANGNEVEIDPAAIYTVISTDYLLRVTGGDYAVVLGKAKNIRPLGLTMRDALTQYVKAETAAGREIKSSLDGRFVFDGPGDAPTEEPQDD
jgi:2',3'-cyclic-nucleotide 2'-phosphodiesterase (5'-nucleotidase family)